MNKTQKTHLKWIGDEESGKTPSVMRLSNRTVDKLTEMGFVAQVDKGTWISYKLTESGWAAYASL